jgi:hypothetical protein
MNAVLTKPLVGVQQGTRVTKTLPMGAVVELSSDLLGGLVDLDWNGLCFWVYRDDLLDACSVADVGRICWR